MDTALSTAPEVGRLRPLGYRMSCTPCEVAWTGEKGSPCWVCGEPGTSGPEPNVYPSAAH